MKFKNEDASEASIRVPQNSVKCCKMLQNAAKCRKMPQNAANVRIIFGVKIQSLKNCKPSILSIITIHSLLNHFLSLV